SPPGLFKIAAIGSLRRYCAKRALAPDTVARRNHYSLVCGILRNGVLPFIFLLPSHRDRDILLLGSNRNHERQERRLAGHAGLDGPQDSAGHGVAARLWDRAEDRADQRRPSGGESGHALP